MKISWIIPEPKLRGRKQSKDPICNDWGSRLQSFTPLYPSLKKLVFNLTELLKLHPRIESSRDLREVPRIAVHLKIVTGTYMYLL